MSEQSFHELGGVLAALLPRARRRGIAAAALVIALTAAGVVFAIQSLAAPRRGLLATLPGPRGRQEYSAAFSPDGKTLAVVNSGGISLWDVAARRWTATLTAAGCQQGEGPVVFSPDGKTLAQFMGTTCLWNLATGRETSLADSSSSCAVDGAFSPGGTTLAVADCNPDDEPGKSGTIYLWDVATRRLAGTLPVPGTGNDVDSLAFGPGGVLAGLGSEGNVYLWDVATRRLTATLGIGGQYGDTILTFTSLAFGPGGVVAVAASGGGIVCLVNVTTRELMATIHLPFSLAQAQASEPQGASIVGTSAVFSPDGKILAASADYGFGTYLYDVATRKMLATLTDPGTENVSHPRLAFSPHGSMLAAVDYNGRTYLWNTG